MNRSKTNYSRIFSYIPYTFITNTVVCLMAATQQLLRHTHAPPVYKTEH